jgi:hypothetical protein
MSRVAPCPQRPFVERDLVIEIVGVDDAAGQQSERREHRRVGPFAEPTIRQEHDWGCCTRMEGADRPASVRAP